MALPSNWYFGSRNPLGEFGGFNLGNIQPVGLTPFGAPASTVSTPTVGVSGTQPGRPPATGGMAVGQQSEPTGAGDNSAGPAPTSDAPGMAIAHLPAVAESPPSAGSLAPFPFGPRAKAYGRT